MTPFFDEYKNLGMKWAKVFIKVKRGRNVVTPVVIGYPFKNCVMEPGQLVPNSDHQFEPSTQSFGFFLVFLNQMDLKNTSRVCQGRFGENKPQKMQI